MRPRTARGALVAALAALLLAAVPLLARAAASTLDATFAFNDDTVTVRGSLTSAGAPLAGEELQLYLDGDEVASAPTRRNGAFTINLPVPADIEPGTHRVELHFLGNGEADPASAAYQFTIARQTQALHLRVEAPETASNGEVVTLAGSLKTEGGKGVAGAGISVRDAGGDVDESYTLTNSNGYFETFYTIPEAQPDGEFALTLSFRGTDSLKAASTTVRMEIEFTDVAPEPTDPAEESPSPSPEPTEDASPSPSPASPLPSPSAASPAQEAPGQPGGSLGWYILALAAVGTVVVGAATALIVRGRIRSRHADEDSEGLAMFADEPEAPVGRRGLPPQDD
jgi:phage baseplate assembly protein gpV